MECHVCLEAFDANDRRPKSLPCGHTLCLRCVQGLKPKKCPVDNLVFEAAADKLPDNFTVLQLSSRPAEARFWCLKCERAASDDCLEDHAVCSLKRARAQEAEPLLEALLRGEYGLEKLGEALDASREQLQQEKEDLIAARGRLEDAMGADAATWTEAKQAAAQDGLSWDAAQLAADLVDPTVRCRVTLQRGAAGDVAWRGEVRPVGDAAARLLLCGLARRGALQQQDELQGEQQDAAAPRWKECDNELCEESMAARMAVGSKVVRGSDWRPDCTDDGTPPGEGTVTSVNSSRDVSVKWDSGSTGTYYMGRDGLYQLQLLAPAAWKSRVASWYHQCLDVEDAAPAASFKKMSTLLTDGRLAQARALVGLPCLSAPTWTQKVLQQVAPHLEGLELVSPQQRHLDLAMAMPRLQTLEVHCSFEGSLPVVAYPKTTLRWLRCGVYPLAAALALVRANAETLEELQLVAASRKPYGCPDLAAELRRCGLKKLRRLVLLRETVYHEICRHDKESCQAQKTELWVVFVDSGLAPSLLCSECDRKEG